MAVRAKPPVYSVSAVNHHISSLFEGDPVLGHIYVRGELSNVKYASRY
jgi:exodeoxyribonuclease VII large subunit